MINVQNHEFHIFQLVTIQTLQLSKQYRMSCLAFSAEANYSLLASATCYKTGIHPGHGKVLLKWPCKWKSF